MRCTQAPPDVYGLVVIRPPSTYWGKPTTLGSTMTQPYP